jgi:hypothetical protein
MRANVRRYPWFVAAAGFSPWLPVFFLYLSERVGFDGAVTLSAVYYLSVVVLEVPSGYLSDRVGRRPTLVVASLSLCLAYIGFASASSFLAFACCQVLLAGGIAFQSGSDSALLHDSLAAIDETDSYAKEEARSRSVSLATTSASCVLGGLLGSVALWLPYTLAAVASVVAVACAWRFTEPPVDRSDAATLASQGRAVAGRLGDRVLLWLMLWYVLAFTLAHIPFEFYQPWIRLLGEGGSEWGQRLAQAERAPIVSGVVMALSMFGGMLGAMVSLAIAERVTLPTLLLLANAIQLLIAASLAIWLHPIALMLVLIRNFGMNMTHAPLMAAIAPRIKSSERATWLSLQSLFGRLGFSVVMFGLSAYVGESVEWPILARVLMVTVVIGTAMATVVWMIGRSVNRRQDTTE